MTNLDTNLHWRKALRAGFRFLRNSTFNVFYHLYERRLEKRIQNLEIPKHLESETFTQ